MAEPFRPAGTTLENCDREPIHIPGAIQPHGALLAFDRLGRLTHHSANARDLLGFAPAFGRPLRLDELGGDTALHALLTEVLAEATDDEVSARSTETRLAGRSFDVVMHGAGGVTLCEFEVRSLDDGEATRFAHLAYRAMDGLKRQRHVDRLLNAAVVAVRELTGFDRVMAYRFRFDDSGDVVAEARDDALDAYVGRRYPASDIPAQARRLYTLNTLRLIADLGDVPVPVLAAPSQREPLDMSHGVLRSVSPIHIEYLRNMGVGASMSVSIVVGGRLWGMLACHHMAPRRVPYPIRMAVDVMAQVIASTAQTLEAQAREASAARAAWLRTEISRGISQGTDIAEVVRMHEAPLLEQFGADALVVCFDGTVRQSDGVDPAWLQALMPWLAAQHDAIVHVHTLAALPPPPDDLPPAQRHCGLLGLCFDAPHQGWLVALRREQVQTIRWGGRPEKEIAHGPLGPRLTPRGSFDEWRETVRDTAEPWSALQLEIAAQLLDAMSRATAERVHEVDQLRSQLWAVLGHDLRGPLQSLRMASHILDRQEGQGPARMRDVIRNSTTRMSQLVSNVLDVSRLHHGLELTLAVEPFDLVPLVQQLLEETRVAHPTVAVAVELPASLPAQVDPVRYAQVVANLLSNARHHGRGDVRLALRTEDGAAVLTVRNAGGPIPDEVAATLFDPFKRRSIGNPLNRTGMGLGLYIAHQVMQAHGGTLRHVAGDGTITFEARLPPALSPSEPTPAPSARTPVP